MENKRQIEINILNKVVKDIKNTSVQLNPDMTPRDIEMWRSGIETALLIIETTLDFLKEDN